jgi:hypothetical protein
MSGEAQFDPVPRVGQQRDSRAEKDWDDANLNGVDESVNGETAEERSTAE